MPVSLCRGVAIRVNTHVFHQFVTDVSVSTTELEKGGCGFRNVLAGDELHHVAGETSVSQIDDVVGPARRILTAEDGAKY